METNIKLNTQVKTAVPKINGIDMLANAKPIRLNSAPQQQSARNTKEQEIPKEANKTQQIRVNNQTLNNKTESQTINSINKQNITPTQPIQQSRQPISKQNTAPSKQTIQAVQPTKQTIQPTQQQRQPQPRMQQPVQRQAPNINQNPPQAAPKTLVEQSAKPINTQHTQEQRQENQYNGAEINLENKTDIPIEDMNRNPNIGSLVVNVDKLDFAITKRVRTYLKKLINIGGSDLHLKAGSKVRARINGDIVIFSEDIFSKEDAITFAKELTRTRFPEFALNKEMDMTYIYDSNTRFRVNIYFQMEGVSFAFRSIPTTQSTIDELGLPRAISNIVDMERGLVLVTGITGSGKSTTLAAIINEINQKKSKHIITIEDPIEFIHKDAKSILNQRSVGMDTNSFAAALKAALREDPDIILVGEMRDVETIEMALHAAETGHLVLSTLHTLDAKETINRIVSVFPTNDQLRIRATLGSTLAAIISQRLLKARNGGRVAAVELLFKTPRIELIINEGRDGEILEALAEGKEIYNTQTFDQHLFELVVNGIVDEDVAMEKATSPSDLKLRLQNINFTDQEGADTISIKN